MRGKEGDSYIQRAISDPSRNGFLRNLVLRILICDVDNIGEFRVKAALDEMQNAVSALDEGFFLWWVVDKKKQRNYAKSQF